MNPLLKQAALHGDVTVLDRIRLGELHLNDSNFLSSEDDNFIQYAARHNQESFICEVITTIEPKLLLQLLSRRNRIGSNTFHYVAYFGCLKATKAVVEFCQRNQHLIIGQVPWKATNDVGNMPIHDALDRRYDEIASYLLSQDDLLYDKLNNPKESPLFLAMQSGCRQFIEKILNSNLPMTSSSVSGSLGKTALHQAIIDKYEESIVGRLLAKLNGQTNIIWAMDSKGWTALHYAAAEGIDWQIELLLLQTPPPSNYMLDQNSESPLILACNKGHHSSVQVMLRCYPAIVQWLSDNQTTILHHFKLQSQQEYRNILQIPETRGILNVTDNNGMTPLHQAIYDGNILLAELLFQTDGVDKNIQNRDGKTPIHLLLERSRHSQRFAALSNTVLPSVSYVPYRADMKEVRSTVMVVAALLATITFQASFTIPDTIEKSIPLFVLFLIADTFAMCCSLVVLFWLIWAIIEDDHEKSRSIVDRSFFVLVLSFYGTLVAFAVVVFATAFDKSLALAIVVIFICAIVALLSHKTIVSKFFKVDGSLRLSWRSCSRGTICGKCGSCGDANA